jgi:hypothetical protein
MVKAALDPLKYSRISPLPHHGVLDDRLVGRKIEMTLHLKAADEVAYPDGFVHCLEGEIIFVQPQAKAEAMRTVKGVRTKWAVAEIKWDDEIGMEASAHPLNPGMYV